MEYRETVVDAYVGSGFNLWVETRSDDYGMFAIEARVYDPTVADSEFNAEPITIWNREDKEGAIE